MHVKIYLGILLKLKNSKGGRGIPKKRVRKPKRKPNWQKS